MYKTWLHIRETNIRRHTNLRSVEYAIHERLTAWNRTQFPHKAIHGGYDTKPCWNSMNAINYVVGCHGQTIRTFMNVAVLLQAKEVAGLHDG